VELGMTTIQRNRGPWLIEWFAFHYLVGFRHFYFYAHLCTDETIKVLENLCRKINIKVVVINELVDRVQLIAYQHSCDNYLSEVDWMAFIDGDEFIFSPSNDSIISSIDKFSHLPISAIGVYNVNFGSNGHIEEPDGLITENYRRCCSDASFLANRRVKSIVRGREKTTVTNCGHIFNTTQGTIDELGRPVLWGFMQDYVPSYQYFRINHYVCQSYKYFQTFKSASGHADASAQAVRGEDWWINFNRNDVFDSSLERFYEGLRQTMDWLAP